jgi:thiaminase/transcriptional activator TenA
MTNIQPKGEFTSNLWTSIGDLFEKITACAFVNNLSNGQLNHSCFAHYLSQDIIYIREDNKALEQLSKRADNDQHKAFFHKLAEEGLAVEKALHDEFLNYFKVQEIFTQSPAFKVYCEFILTHAQISPFSVGAAALLPCFWLYAEVGKTISSSSIPNNKYQKFIDTYSGEEFEKYVDQYITIVEELGVNADPETKVLMKKAFMEASRYELLIFEEAIQM